jgi:hypothetical protein
VSQHSNLDLERWAKFDLDQQILMIGNEMNRASRFLGTDQLPSFRRGYERVLRLTDLTVECKPRPMLLRELLRWRELAAALYISEAPAAERHRALFRALLQLRPEAAKQIPLLGMTLPRART